MRVKVSETLCWYSRVHVNAYVICNLLYLHVLHCIICMCFPLIRAVHMCMCVFNFSAEIHALRSALLKGGHICVYLTECNMYVTYILHTDHVTFVHQFRAKSAPTIKGGSVCSTSMARERCWHWWSGPAARRQWQGQTLQYQFPHQLILSAKITSGIFRTGVSSSLVTLRVCLSLPPPKTKNQM